MRSPRYTVAERDGYPVWLDELTGRYLPIVAGAEDAAETAAAEAKAAEDAAAAAKTAEEEAAAAAAKAEEEGSDDVARLKATLEKERKDRRDADKRAKAAEAKVKAAEEKDLDEKQKAERRAEEAEGKVTAATEKLRRANLLSALADEGLTGANAKAAARLLDGVEYDDADEPTNLADRITAAKQEYGDSLFKAGRRKAPDIDGGGGGGNNGEKPKLTAEELAAAKSFGMTPEEYAAYKDPTYSRPKAAAK